MTNTKSSLNKYLPIGLAAAATGSTLITTQPVLATSPIDDLGGHIDTIKTGVDTIAPIAVIVVGLGIAMMFVKKLAYKS